MRTGRSKAVCLFLFGKRIDCFNRYKLFTKVLRIRGLAMEKRCCKKNKGNQPETEKSKENTVREKKQMGRQSIVFSDRPVILAASSVVGKKEGEGPLGGFFDEVEQDPMFGGKNWEDAESRMMRRTAERVIEKAGMVKEDIRFLVGGDLLGQLIATSFGIETLEIPTLGVYGACSTMGESLLVAASLADSGYADRVMAITSSHFAGAEKQFRFPLGYGNQRPQAATWTVTGSGAVIVGSAMYHDAAGTKTKVISDSEKDSAIESQGMKGRKICVAAATVGKIVDFGVKDSMNMGACMAPAAADTIARHLLDFGVGPGYYDKIITGDLGYVGKDILVDLLLQKGYDIGKNHMDCGIAIYDRETQDTHSGGSGCGCSAVTLSAYILRNMCGGKWNRVLFVPTGALLSTVSFNEGQSVPGIAHAVVLEAE